MVKKCDKKVAMITGAASGIGHATAKRFRDEGYIPVIIDINLENAEKIAAELGGMAVKTDVTKYEECVAAAEAVMAAYGRIDILVNCAGGASGRMLNMPGCMHEVPISRLEWGIALNLMGPLYMTHAVINHMIDARFGRIIYLGSAAGVVGAVGGVDYSASKGGLESLTKSLAMEVGKYGINVCIVSPGPIMTRPGNAAGNSFLGRPGEPEEVANVINFLCSEEASFVTGHNYIVDGGRCLGGLPWGEKNRIEKKY